MAALRRPLLASILLAASLSITLPTMATALPTDGGGSDSVFDSGLAIGLAAGGVALAVGVSAALYWGIGGLKHVDRRNVLEHPLRKAMMATIEEEPGIHLRELACRHETAVTNTNWHLRKLESAEMIRTQKVQGRRLYYPADGGIQARDQALQNAALRNPNAQAIVDYLRGNPGSNQRTMAEALGMNPGTVRWHLRKMEHASVVRAVPEGAQIRYFLLEVHAPMEAVATHVPDMVAAED